MSSCAATNPLCNALTGFRQELDGLQDTLGVDSRFVVFHLSINDVDNTSSPATDGSSSSVKSVDVSLLQSYYAFVDILKNVVLFGRKENIDSEWTRTDPSLSQRYINIGLNNISCSLGEKKKCVSKTENAKCSVKFPLLIWDQVAGVAV